MELPNKRLDRTISFGCGAVLGLFVSFFGVLSAGYGLMASLGIASGVAILLGLLSVVFGDRFLEGLVKWLSW